MLESTLGDTHNINGINIYYIKIKNEEAAMLLLTSGQVQVLLSFDHHTLRLDSGSDISMEPNPYFKPK